MAIKNSGGRKGPWGSSWRNEAGIGIVRLLDFYTTGMGEQWQRPYVGEAEQSSRQVQCPGGRRCPGED